MDFFHCIEKIASTYYSQSILTIQGYFRIFLRIFLFSTHKNTVARCAEPNADKEISDRAVNNILFVIGGNRRRRFLSIRGFPCQLQVLSHRVGGEMQQQQSDAKGNQPKQNYREFFLHHIPPQNKRDS